MPTKRPACEDHDIAKHPEKRFKDHESEGLQLGTSRQKRGNGDYTIGWICAITTEYVAAQAFLDTTHDPPESTPLNDNNNYTLGEMGKHKVVIAVLPKGGYGTTSAASVARDMLRTFPNVRIGLMVGIGGGAPSPEYDIRLGDIVVSTPHNREGGVFQYDFGKTIQDKAFQVTGHLNKPPTVFATAVSKLESKYVLHGHQLEEAITNILKKYPRLGKQKKYERPNPDTDKLYQSELKHPDEDEGANCAVVCGDNPFNLVLRNPRTQDDDNPAVHYGIIASANQLMKDALLRDKITKENGVLCFEMEAAGLMNHFPCLVIRGICDYSDTHKSKEWQGYAAMTAAAYAKELLTCMPVNKVEAEDRISDVLYSTVEHGVHKTSSSVRRIELEQQQTKISQWLSPPDPSTNYNAALRQRQEGTGLWLLQNPSFAKWKTQKNSFLWLHGIPGCGKTVLSSTVIESLEKSFSTQPLLFFYFNFSDTQKQTLEQMVRSLISQLYYKCTDAQEQLEPLFSSCQNGRSQPSCETLCKALSKMIEHAKEVWIVLDALDECQTRVGPSREELLEWIGEILSSEHMNVHLVVTSRPEHDIQEELNNVAERRGKIIPIQSDLVEDDICKYIRVHVNEGKGLKRWQSRPDIQDKIRTSLMQKANGILDRFRWVSCQIDALQRCPDPHSLEDALHSLPKDLNETYSRILSAIPSEYKLAATRLFQFLTFSERPLTVGEAIDAIAVKLEGEQYFSPEYRIPDPNEILLYCSSLVVKVNVSWRKLRNQKMNEHVELQLAHFSVKEYLTSSQVGNSMAKSMDETTARASISAYSATYWMDHAEIAESKGYNLTDWTGRFFDPQIPAFNICYSLYRLDTSWDRETIYEAQDHAPPLYYASIGNLVVTVRLLLERGANVHARGGYYGNALQAASVRGHEAIVKQLIQNSANVNAQGGQYGNALQAASAKGHEAIVKLLIENDADVNAQGGEYGNALQAASIEGHGAIVKLLIKNNANVNAHGGAYENVLQAALLEGYEAVLKLLIETNANVNAQGGAYGNALQAASVRGHEAIVQLLIENNANVNAQGGHYGNALQAASVRGYEVIVKLLIENNANVNAQGGYYGNALQAASAKGNEAIIKLLIENNANVNAQGGHYRNALEAASNEGHKAIIQLLIENNASVDTQDEYYRNAL
ncbi:hypothetical protein N0V90_012847 [Kalmusia sp. IMI 367209]|nr:hypothetical protein N0V90_012847 [Kalmusia sp. IMI 367209]